MVTGMDYGDRIKKGSTAPDGRVVTNPEKIEQVRMVDELAKKT